jgi:signal transduction histidine kinase
MTALDTSLVDRLTQHKTLQDAPRAELEWLVARSTTGVIPKGQTFIVSGQAIDEMYVSLSGHLVFYATRAGGRRKIFEWRGGEVGGVLPYSRARTSPGEAIVEEEMEYLALHRDHHQEMARVCPAITTACVHAMLDRARVFTRSDLHDEKLASLGKLAASLAHELNNPASAAARSAKLLEAGLAEAEAAAAPLAMLNEEQAAALAEVRAEALQSGMTSTAAYRTALEQSDREDTLSDWLAAHGVDDHMAAELAHTPLTVADLNGLAKSMADEQLSIAIRWLAAASALRALATDIERATSRIHDLVTATKRFTYMDQTTTPEPVDVEQGIRDSAAMLAGKARHEQIVVDIQLPTPLPRVLGYGGELNQVWLNLLDNAIDAAKQRVTVTTDVNGQLLSVRVVDDGAGISPEARARIFEPFFTTKPVGQGTGLGLDTVRRILARHEGDVSVTSQDGRTEFCVTLPTDK